MYTVHVRFEQVDMQPIILKGVDHGRTILELLLANNIELNHECGGICSCTTCHVHIENGMNHVEEKSRREEDVLRMKLHDRHNATRLSCQALITEGHGSIDILIPTQTTR
jgi:2Fe-2S ferredoxin